MGGIWKREAGESESNEPSPERERERLLPGSERKVCVRQNR